MIGLFFALLVAHALCDYPLQGDFLARAKNHRQPVPGVPWYQALAAHALIHAGAVAYLTGSLWLGVAEFGLHVAIDHAKCDGAFGFDFDQFLHVVCKLAWVIILQGATA